MLTLHNTKEIPRVSWITTTAAHAMIAVEKLSRIDPNAELWTAMEKMGRTGFNQVPVIMGRSTIPIDRDVTMGIPAGRPQRMSP